SKRLAGVIKAPLAIRMLFSGSYCRGTLREPQPNQPTLARPFYFMPECPARCRSGIPALIHP
ncbi:hypothetical protein, partial [Paraburkholderia tropica]|uniref:hypothetical protein n=1 Tax=Paraburkholderia tropica TaxID=92647 RepID=UPI002AB62538